jgi:hypothetical protein
MRIMSLSLLAAGLCAGQTAPVPQPGSALIRGVLLERDAPAPEGEFSVRLADNRVFRYRFDRKTYVEREHDLIDVARLHPGEKVEVVSDSIPGFVLRYARTIHVIEDPQTPRLTGAAQGPTTQGRYRAYRSAEERERLLPTGNLTYAGVVSHLTPDRLVLHTRDGAEQTLLVGKETRFVQDGALVAADTLKLNTRVFIRAGKDLYDQVQAYQVIWGSILAPQ